MDLQPATPAHAAPDASAGAGGDAVRTPLERKTAMMEELAELSMSMARAAARRALAAEAAAEAAEAAAERAQALPPAYVAPPYPAVPSQPADGDGDADALAAAAVAIADPHLAFHRAARAVRTSVALWRQLEREKDADAAAAALAAVEARRARAAARRLSAGRIVERVAHDHFETAIPGRDRDGEAIVAAQAAVREARERLDDEDLFGDLADAPLSEIVARVCRDAGVSPDWARLAGEDWAQAEIVGGPEGRRLVGAPLAGLARAGSGEGSSAHRLPPVDARPRARSVRWRRRHDETPPEPPTTLRVLFVEPDGKGGFTEEAYRPDARGLHQRAPPPTPAPTEPPPSTPPPAPPPGRAGRAELDLVSSPARNAPMDIANPWLD